jgi:hypothetical protein
METSDWLAAYEMKSQRLRAIDAGVSAKLRSALGSQWQFATEEQLEASLSPQQRDREMLRYFHESLVNSGDPFTCVRLIYDHPEAFRTIGATKTLPRTRCGAYLIARSICNRKMKGMRFGRRQKNNDCQLSGLPKVSLSSLTCRSDLQRAIPPSFHLLRR